MKPVIVLEMHNGIVECMSNKTNAEIVLHDFDIEGTTDNPNFEYGEVDGDDFMIVRFPVEVTLAEPQHSREPDKPKPLAQYLDEYITYESRHGVNFGIGSYSNLFQQALDAYESTENVTIKIEGK